MSTTAGAEFPFPVGSGNHLFTASIAADFSSDFDANLASAANFTKVTVDFPAAIQSVASVLRALMSGSVWSGQFSDAFGPLSGGGAPFEALLSNQRAASGDAIAPVELGLTARVDPAAVAELGLTARADPTIAREAVSSIPANANSALATSASLRAEAPLAREFVASGQFHLLFPTEWLVARRRENTAPAESLVRARADAVVRVEGAALLFLDSNMPTEQSSAAAALLLLTPAESGALRSSHAILPGESLSGAAIKKVDALLSIEALGATRRDAPVAGESWDTYVVRVTLTLSDGRVLTFATTATPTAAT